MREGFRASDPGKDSQAMFMTILIVILILMLLGAVPAWRHSADWGYGPSGLLGVVLVILLILMVTGTRF
jgi:hypothetical protein